MSLGFPAPRIQGRMVLYGSQGYVSIYVGAPTRHSKSALALNPTTLYYYTFQSPQASRPDGELPRSC
jgi:hypothetical protein